MFCSFAIAGSFFMYACIHAPGLRTLAAYGREFSPLVEEVSDGTVVFEAGGLGRIYGPPREVAAAIARRAGPQANVAMAQTPEAALYAARGIAGVTVIPPGEELRFLGDLPIEILSPPPEIRETLELWGIRTFRELAALPPEGIAERLGPEGVRLQEFARGRGGRPLVHTEPESVVEESMELEDPVSLLEPLSFILGRLLGGIFGNRCIAANELRLRLKLADGSEHARTFRLPYPMRDRAAFLKLIQLALDSDSPRAPVIAVSLAAVPAAPRVIQHGMFVPAAPDPEKLELTLARIAKLTGAGNAGSPELIDTHRPGGFRMAPVAQGSHGFCGRPAAFSPASATCLAFRAIRPALSAKVKTVSGRPAQVCAPNICGEVVRAAGPWRSSGEWWAEAWSRDEWDVTLDDGALYRIFFDRQKAVWCVEGSYD
jgi:protein ImuB